MNIILQQLPSLSSNFLNWVMVVQALGSLVISVLIYMVYANIREIQSSQTSILGKQAEIMQRQNNILSAEYQPDISAQLCTDKVDWDDSLGETDNVLAFELANNGRGKAKNLHISTFVYRLSGEIGVEKPEYGPISEFLAVEWGFIPQAYPTKLQQVDPDADTMDVIPPDGESRYYRSEFEVIISRLSDSDYIATFGELMDVATKEWNEKTDALGFEIFISYTDDTKRFDYTSVCSIIDVPLKKGMDLHEGLERGRIWNLPMSHFIPAGLDRDTPETLVE